MSIRIQDIKSLILDLSIFSVYGHGARSIFMHMLCCIVHAAYPALGRSRLIIISHNTVATCPLLLTCSLKLLIHICIPVFLKIMLWDWYSNRTSFFFKAETKSDYNQNYLCYAPKSWWSRPKTYVFFLEKYWQEISAVTLRQLVPSLECYKVIYHLT